MALIRISSRLRPGRYDLVLVDMARNHIETKAPVWVYGPHSRARLTSDRRTYPVGSPVQVSWTRAPGDNLDWIGLFRCHRTCGGPGSYLVYRYTRTAIEGTVTFGRHVYLGEGSVSWPLPPAQYVARLLVDDSYHARGVSLAVPDRAALTTYPDLPRRANDTCGLVPNRTPRAQKCAVGDQTAHVCGAGISVPARRSTC